MLLGWEYLISNHKVMLHGLSEEVLDRTFVKEMNK